MNANWVSLKPGTEFYDETKTRSELAAFFGNGSDDTEMAEEEDLAKLGIPGAISSMLDKPLAIEALGGMMFYLRSLNMANDLLSQRSFNVYDPIRKGENLVLDGQTLSHLEVSRPGHIIKAMSTDCNARRSWSTTKAVKREHFCSFYSDARLRSGNDSSGYGLQFHCRRLTPSVPG